MRLCTVSGIYPPCLTLQDICYEPNPVAAGCFGEIWKGYLRNQPVSLKVAKLYQKSKIEHLIKVSL